MTRVRSAPYTYLYYANYARNYEYVEIVLFFVYYPDSTGTHVSILHILEYLQIGFYGRVLENVLR